MSLDPKLLFQRKIIVEEISRFTRHLATFLNAGDSLQRSLRTLRGRVWTAKIKKMIEAVGKDVDNGVPLSLALAKYPNLFPPTYIQTVKVGEMNGILGKVLAGLAEVNENEYLRHLMYRGASIYPVTMLIISLCVIIFLLVKIIPTFAEMFQQMGVELPLPTKIVMKLSAFLVTHWWVCLIALTVFTMAAICVSKIPRVRAFLDRSSFSLPISGEIVKKDYICRVTRILGILVTCDVDIVQSLKSVSNVTDNLHVSSVLNGMIEQIQRGNLLSKAFKDSNFFPQVLVTYIAEGEKAGIIGKHLLEFENRYDTLLDETVIALYAIQEPLLIVFMGGAIGLIVMAMFFPMFEMINLTKDEKSKQTKIVHQETKRDLQSDTKTK